MSLRAAMSPRSISEQLAPAAIRNLRGPVGPANPGSAPTATPNANGSAVRH